MTPAQRQALDAYEKAGNNQTAAARALGIARSSFQERLSRAKNHLQLDPGIQDALADVGIQDHAKVRDGWLKTKGASVRFVMPEDNSALERYADIVAEAMSKVPAARPTSRPQTNSDLLTRYIIADLHLGLHVWAEQCDQDYDIKIATERLHSSMADLTSSTPRSEVGVILNLGDMFHANDQRNVTPTSNHLLDMDGRFPKIALAGVDAIVSCIEMAKNKHARVIYAGVPGNHDPDQFHWLTIALMRHYRDDPRVDVRWNPRDFFFHQWGKVMLAAHHGHKASWQKLVMFIADQQSRMWAETNWRYLDTGHLHHDAAEEIGGMYCQRHRTIAARDRYSFGSAYTNRQTMKAITVHKELGEVLSSTTPIIYPQ